MAFPLRYACYAHFPVMRTFCTHLLLLFLENCIANFREMQISKQCCIWVRELDEHLLHPCLCLILPVVNLLSPQAFHWFFAAMKIQSLVGEGGILCTLIWRLKLGGWSHTSKPLTFHHLCITWSLCPSSNFRATSDLPESLVNLTHYLCNLWLFYDSSKHLPCVNRVVQFCKRK